ncbi:MAG: DnaJ C-terminal domain-containing protein, partial [Dehalococcoidales bacterium]|nr:DnaJ C-terminal domain-containing protein [Dehalococcoidales bacterium]
DVHFDLEINFAQAALGSEIDVPTLYGDEKIKVPAGTQSGAVFKLKNKGIRRLQRSGQGDQLVNLRVITPEKLTKKQKELFEQLQESFNGGKTVKRKAKR